MSLIRLPVAASLAALGSLIVSTSALAAVNVSKAELSGTQLRVEGTASPNRPITVDGVAMTTSDPQGRFKLQNDSFAQPSNCRVSVNDGSATPATATLAGCTVSAPSSPPPLSPSPPQSPPQSPSPAPASPAALSSVTLNPTDVIGGGSSTGTVTLSGAAPAGGETVALTVDTSEGLDASAPPSVTVPAGKTSATFTVTTVAVPGPRSALVIGSVDGVQVNKKYGVITAWTPFLFNNGLVDVMPGGNGSGTVTSQPAGIDCTITNGNGSGGTCSKFFPVGTVVRLDARPAPNNSFVGFRPTPGCIDASRVTVFRGANIACQVGFFPH